MAAQAVTLSHATYQTTQGHITFKTKQLLAKVRELADFMFLLNVTDAQLFQDERE